jgi:leader peptidase (prepilin peptidase) / N-methyltransferase
MNRGPSSVSSFILHPSSFILPNMALLALWFVFVFLAGACVGSLLNVCISRLPYEKSLLWPLRSRCGSCLQPIDWRDNLPVLSYLLLRGRCRTCGVRIPLRYLWVELGTALAFAGLFYAEVVANCLDLPLLRGPWVAPGLPPPAALPVFAHHAVLVSFLIAASVSDILDMEIPLTLTLWGTLVGLVLATLMPWPWPEPAPAPAPPQAGPVGVAFPPYPGAYAWPVWYPLPDWLPPGSWRLGLATGLAGAAAGAVLLRAVRFLFSVGRGLEGLGVGDADLMMMAGAFVGWQPVVVAFFASAFVGLFFAFLLCLIKRRILRGREMLPFGPSLALSVVLVTLSWPAIGARLQLAFFAPFMVVSLSVAGVVAFLIVCLLLRLLG